MRRILEYSIIFAAVLLLAGCGVKGPKKADAKAGEAVMERSFPKAPSVPSIITDQLEANEYLIGHFWDAFLDGDYPCDSAHVNGVASMDVESALGTYVSLLERVCPLDFAKKSIADFFGKVSAFQTAYPSSNVFSWFEKQVSRYLYDPNSPVRNEDLYLEYVSRLAVSPLVSEDMKPAYDHDAKMCALNQAGSPAADFSFTDLSGKRHRLHGVKSDQTILFFTNPGCPACKEIIDAMIRSRSISLLIDQRKLAVVNIYIDRELDKWRECADNYPATWYNGYDQDYRIRTDVIYNVRAIPSIYVLDADKNVIMKDAPVESVLEYLENI